MHIQVREMRQKGFTLIEILVAMAVGGILMAGVVLGIFQVSWGTVRTNDQVVALTDVNNAALWLKKDLQMVQSTTLTDGVTASSVTLDWTDFTGWATEETRDHSSTYALSGTELRRTDEDGVERVVGRHITSIGFTRDSGVINVVITATGPGNSQRTETLKFSVHMRYEGVE